ncbi:hypothetical protein [Kosmotoga pacifica]|uniref:DUF3880 domain-containing protein n=1 Tax=Kosmotoga pacifica TaxID=1330330 RepID=A0A0G2Z982_9BACT|nr:hypothetical protein [Kosmotoga pacifica]AKI96631.1 hypothetical protein IX53_01000 [Kosmotoga pacifica]
MKISNILTRRNFETWHFWQVVYEWEDIFSREFGASLKPLSPFKDRFSKYVFNRYLPTNYLWRLHQNLKSSMSLVFLMSPLQGRYFAMDRQKTVIPIIIDFWKHHIKFFLRNYSSAKIIILTSFEVIDFLQGIYHELGGKHPELLYLPLSVSDKWFTNDAPSKSIDIIQIGRKNPLLHEWALKLTEEFPKIEYVFQKNINGVLHYQSTRNGLMGSFNDRKSYMKLLSQCKVSLVSSPGMDNSRNTGGFNPVTPRFFESAVSYCFMVGRYPRNKDFAFCGVNKVCQIPNSYNEFRDLVLEGLNNGPSYYDSLRNFSKMHLTSVRAKELTELLNTALKTFLLGGE